jgi:hypothetical protein
MRQLDFTDTEIIALTEAKNALDDLWNFDAARGLADSIGGSEYRNQSPAYIIGLLLDEQGVGAR